MRASPLYNAGALAFNVGSETPRVGQAVSSLWNFAVSKLRFKLITSNEEKDKKKASPGSASVDQDERVPEVGSSKISFLFVLLEVQ